MAGEDCRCAVCACCKHDHGGWRHEWTSKEENVDSVYRERAHLVAHLATIYPSTIGYHDPAEPDWAVVVVDAPTGQMSWHVAPDDMDLFRHIDRSEVNTWDGHSTEEKYKRLRRLIGSHLTTVAGG